MHYARGCWTPEYKQAPHVCKKLQHYMATIQLTRFESPGMDVILDCVHARFDVAQYGRLIYW